MEAVRAIVQRLPDPVQRPMRRIARRLRRYHLPVRMGRLRRLEPLVANWGRARGVPVDRYFIERFVRDHRQLIRGRVLEVQYPEYAGKFGDAVTDIEILDIDPSNDHATLIADLRDVGSLPAAAFDCAIVTQTLQFVDDLDAAVVNLWQSVAPGGSLLITMPTVSKLDVSLKDVEAWRVTPHGLDLVMRRSCVGGDVYVEGYGNVLVSTSFLHGLVTADLRRRELDYYDPIFPTGACGRATKPAA